MIASAGCEVVPASVAVAGIEVAAVKTSAGFDSSMIQVAAVFRAIRDDFDALRDKGLEMGSKTKFSASEAADAIYMHKIFKNILLDGSWKVTVFCRVSTVPAPLTITAYAS